MVLEYDFSLKMVTVRFWKEKDKKLHIYIHVLRKPNLNPAAPKHDKKKQKILKERWQKIVLKIQKRDNDNLEEKLIY